MYRQNQRIKMQVEINAQYISKEKILQYPFNTMGKVMSIKNKKQMILGTGFLINPLLVLTSVQLIYDDQNHQQFQEICFQSFKSLKKIYAKKVHYLQEYKNQKEMGKYKYALILLTSQIYLQKYLRLGINLRGNQKILLCGYDSYAQKLKQQIKDKQYEIIKGQKLIRHEFDTYQGIIGAPLFFQDNDQFIVVGIQIKHRNRPEQIIYCNFARLITKDLIIKLSQWQKIFLQNMQYYNLDLKQFQRKQINIDELYSQVSKIDYDASDQFNNLSEQQRRYSRFNSNISFQIKNSFIEYITINGVQLYFDLYNQKKYTIKNLQDQYFQITKCQLNLDNYICQFQQEQSLSMFIKNRQNKQLFQKALNLMNNKKENILLTRNLKINYQLQTKPYQKYKPRDQTNKQIKLLRLNQQNNKTPEQQTSQTKQYAKQNGMTLQITTRIDQRIMNDDYSYDNKTNLRAVIQFISYQKYFLHGKVRIINKEGKQYYQNVYDTPIKDLDLPNNQIKLIFKDIESDSCFGVQTKIATLVNGKFKQKYVTQLQKGQSVLSFYNCQNIYGFQQRQHLKIIQTQNNGFYYYIKYQSHTHGQKLEIKCSQKSYFINSHHLWISVEDISQGQTLIGINKRVETQLEYYRVKQINKIFPEYRQQFFSLQIDQTHNFIANGLIVHNHGQFQLKIIYPLNEEKVQIIKINNNQIIKNIFGEQDLYVAGTCLNNELTFGDYQINKIKLIFVYPPKTKSKISFPYFKDRIFLTQWNKDTTEVNKHHQFSQQDQDHFLGIFNGKIIQLKTSQQLQQITCTKPNLNILKIQKLALQRLFYYEKIKRKQYKDVSYLKNKLQSNQKEKFYQIFNANKSIQNGALTEDDMFYIFYYTSGHIHIQLNKYLRGKSNDYKQIKQQYQSFLYHLTNSILKIPEQKKFVKVFRGIRDASKQLKQFYMNGDKFMILNSFTSTSLKQERAQKFTNKDQSLKLLLVIDTFSGRKITKYSNFKTEQQILIPPLTYFRRQKVQGYRVYLTQIVQPTKSCKNIVFWVDDNPKRNEQTIKKLGQKIEIIQILSTDMFQYIMQNFFCVYKFLNKNIIIVSDMVRQQKQQTSLVAGVDLLKIVYNTYGASNRTFIYTKDDKKALYSINKQKILSNKWKVITSTEDLISAIKQQFQIQ